MANGRIKGITIEIGGNTTKLTESLKDVDKALSTTQSSLKDVNKLLKLDPHNVDLLQQKQKLLTEAVGSTKDRLKILKDSYKELKDSGNTEENQKQMDALQREIIQTENALKGMQTELRNTHPLLDKVGSVASEVAEKTKALSAAAGGVAAAMIGNAVNAGRTADDINTMAKQYGLSTREIQKMNYAQDRIDVSTADMLSSYAKLTKQMGSGSKVFEELGVSIYDVNGELRDSEDVWYDTLEALSQVTNETERDVKAQEIFGKSAASLAGIIDDGGKALKDMGQEAEDLGLILSQDTLDSANEFNDALDTMKAQGTQAFLELGASLATELVPMMQALMDKVSAVVQWFTQLDGETQTVILIILALVAAISPLASLISGVTSVIGNLSSAFTFLLSPVGLVIAAIAAAIAIGVLLWQNWDTIKEKAGELASSVSEKFESIKRNISEKITAAKEKVESVFESIKNAIETKINSAKDAVSSAIEAIKGFFNFQWQLPHLSLPHFSITGYGALGLPQIGVSWYKKAMENAMILNSPTIFGYQNGRFLGAGEAGAEVVVGANTLERMIRQNSSSGTIINMTVNGAVGQNVEDLADIVVHKINMEIKRGRSVWQ